MRRSEALLAEIDNTPFLKTTPLTCDVVLLLSVVYFSGWSHRGERGGKGSKGVRVANTVGYCFLYTFFIFKQHKQQDNKGYLTWAYACCLMGWALSDLDNMQVRALLNSVKETAMVPKWGDSPLSSRSDLACARRFTLAGLVRYPAVMSSPLVPGQPQRTEYSSGPGHFPHPESDFQSHRRLEFTQDYEPLVDQYRDWVTDKRTDPTDPTSVGHEDQANLFVAGNPDTFGPGPALVKATKVVPSGTSPQPVFRTGVTREE